MTTNCKERRQQFEEYFSALEEVGKKLDRRAKELIERAEREEECKVCSESSFTMKNGELVCDECDSQLNVEWY